MRLDLKINTMRVIFSQSLNSITTTAKMVSKTVNPILIKERQKCTFNTEELTNFYDGSAEITKERREISDFFVNDTQFDEKTPLEYLSYVERYEEGLRRSCIMFEKFFKYQEQKGDGVQAFSALLGGEIGDSVYKDGTPFSINYLMFLPAIMSLGTIEQQAKWAVRAWKMNIIGTYAQTELGHGSYIRGLETTATYDPQTKEFILNTPTLTSHKWWPAGLGHTANYAVVFAQLYSLGKGYGPHAFVVQLRDEETHMPLPGLTIGELGCKLGLNGVNQGFLGFNNVRIPRENMLMKNTEILEDGTYVKANLTKKKQYGTMLFVRVLLVKTFGAATLAKAVTIATRYSCIRKQSELIPGEGESFVIEYKTQQYKIFPYIASVMLVSNAAMKLKEKFFAVDYDDVDDQEIETNIAELHALSCCLKAIGTSDAARGIEECRKACGGQGYLTSSGFPNLYSHTTAAETYEGENTVLMLQTARYLLKTWHKAKQGLKMNDSTEYYHTHSNANKNLPWHNNLENVNNAYKQVSIGLIKDASDKINYLISSGVTQEEAWNNYANILIPCVEAHCRSFMIQQFQNLLMTQTLSPELKIVLTQLGELYGAYYILKNLGYFLMYSNIKRDDVTKITDWQNALLTSIRPNAVSIVDSFDISDKVLKSTLGAYDGNVYERLFEEAKKSPLNASPVPEAFEKYIKPLMKSRL